MSFWDDVWTTTKDIGTLGAHRLFEEGGLFNPKPPEKQDLTGAAERQGASETANIAAQTAANRPNQTNAFGSSVNWAQGPDGQWTMSQGFGGPMAGAAQGLQGQLAQAYGQPVMTGDMARDQAINAMYGQATSRLDPQWNQREEQTRTRLMNQGMDPQSEAYANAMGQLSRDRNDAYSSAMNGAIGMGTQAGESVFNQNMAARNAPLQSLLGMQGLLSQPGFQGAGAAGPTQYLGATLGQANLDMARYQADQQKGADIMGGLFSFGGSLAKGG